MTTTDRFSPYRDTILDITDEDILRREEIEADIGDHQRDCEIENDES